MITLTTGLPGAGKTLYTLLLVEAKAKKENRAVYYHGVKELTFDWTEIDDATQAHKLPAGAIIVMDECQTTFRPRSTGSAVPPHVAALETHRHNGHDYFLITQHPMLVDPNIRRLVGNHFHVVRKFGFEKSVIHEWKALKESPDKNRSDSIRHDFIYPKSQYGFYKSAEIHTVKGKLPMRVWFLWVGAPIILTILIFAAYKVLNRMSHPDQQPAESTVNAKPGLMQFDNQQGGQKKNWYAEQVPRIAELTYTAPKYDDVTKPAYAPAPSACVASKSRCQCYTDQATKLDVGESICRQIAANGFFIDWKQENRPRPDMHTGQMQSSMPQQSDMPPSRTERPLAPQSS